MRGTCSRAGCRMGRVVHLCCCDVISTCALLYFLCPELDPGCWNSTQTFCTLDLASTLIPQFAAVLFNCHSSTECIVEARHCGRHTHTLPHTIPSELNTTSTSIAFVKLLFAFSQLLISTLVISLSSLLSISILFFYVFFFFCQRSGGKDRRYP